MINKFGKRFEQHLQHSDWLFENGITFSRLQPLFGIHKKYLFFCQSKCFSHFITQWKIQWSFTTQINENEMMRKIADISCFLLLLVGRTKDKRKKLDGDHDGDWIYTMAARPAATELAPKIMAGIPALTLPGHEKRSFDLFTSRSIRVLPKMSTM